MFSLFTSLVFLAATVLVTFAVGAGISALFKEYFEPHFDDTNQKCPPDREEPIELDPFLFTYAPAERSDIDLSLSSVIVDSDFSARFHPSSSEPLLSMDDESEDDSLPSYLGIPRCSAQLIC